MTSPSPGPEDLSAQPKIPEEDTGDLPVTLSASVVLTSLPRDGRLALDKALSPKPTKVSIRFKAIGSAPILNKDVYKIKTNQRFENVVKFLRDNLDIPASESIFTYINSTFAPALDENVGNLYSSFKVDDQLIVSYCRTAAFG